MESQQYDNYFLKRKLSNENCDDQNGYVQSKKRNIKIIDFTNNYNDNNYTDGYNNIISNNTYTIECQNIEFLNFENSLMPIQSIERESYNNEQFDTNWNNSDILELGQKYNCINNTSSSSPSSTVCLIEKPLIETLKNPTNLPQPDPDFEDKNLSWLFNYKLNELPHLSPEVNRCNQQQSSNKSSKNCQTQLQKNGRRFDDIFVENHTEIDESDIIVGENVIVDQPQKTPKKPPFTYTELIEYALEEKRELTVSGIYQWISDRFPFYKSNDDRWKNSVRHNLSINPHFRKGVKAPQGAGHLWTISSRDSEENALAWEHKKQRLELFFKMETSQKRTSPQLNDVLDEAATAAANIAQQLRTETGSPEHNSNNSPTNRTDTQIPMDIIQQNDLRKTAGEILNGVRRSVEVQAVHSIITTYHDQGTFEAEILGDYLNPISEDDIVIESGLRSNQQRNDINEGGCYVTDIDPIELGINMSNVEEEVLFSDEFNLNYFGISSANDIMA